MIGNGSMNKSFSLIDYYNFKLMRWLSTKYPYLPLYMSTPSKYVPIYIYYLSPYVISIINSLQVKDYTTHV